MDSGRAVLATAIKKAAYSAAFNCGEDLNLRPLGYEPRETMDAFVISTT
jgi:hypothetical protein